MHACTQAAAKRFGGDEEEEEEEPDSDPSASREFKCPIDYDTVDEYLLFQDVLTGAHHASCASIRLFHACHCMSLQV